MSRRVEKINFYWLKKLVEKIPEQEMDVTTTWAMKNFISWYNSCVDEIKQGNVIGLDTPPNLEDPEEKERLKMYWNHFAAEAIYGSKSKFRNDGSRKVTKMSPKWLRDFINRDVPEVQNHFVTELIEDTVDRYNIQSDNLASQGGPILDLEDPQTKDKVRKTLKYIAHTHEPDFSSMTVEPSVEDL